MIMNFIYKKICKKNMYKKINILLVKLGSRSTAK